MLEDDADFALGLAVPLFDLNIVVFMDLRKGGATVTMEGCCSLFMR